MKSLRALRPVFLLIRTVECLFPEWLVGTNDIDTKENESVRYEGSGFINLDFSFLPGEGQKEREVKIVKILRGRGYV